MDDSVSGLQPSREEGCAVLMLPQRRRGEGEADSQGRSTD